MVATFSPSPNKIVWQHLATYPSKIDLISGKCNSIVVEQVDKKQCCKCRGHQVLEMFKGDNATCNGCLAHRKKWAGNNPAKVRELSQRSGEHKEEKKAYNQEYNGRETCEVKKCNWLRHLRTKKHRDGVVNGGGG